MLVLPVADVEASVAHYTSAFGWTVDFVDGARWAQLDAGGTTVALAGPGGGVEGTAISLAVKTTDVAEVERVAGGQAEEGPHEVSAQIVDPDGHVTRLYAPRT